MEVATQTIEKPRYYTEAQKRAIYNYREKNREKINEEFKKYAKNRYNNDEEHRELKKKKALDNYYKRKEKLKNFIIGPAEPKELVELNAEPKEEPKETIPKLKEGELLNFYLNNGLNNTMALARPIIKDI